MTISDTEYNNIMNSLDGLKTSLQVLDPGGGGSSTPGSGTSSPMGGTGTVTGEQKELSKDIKFGQSLAALTEKMFAFKNIAGESYELYSEIVEYGTEKYDPLQKMFGGLSDLKAKDMNETSRAMMEGIDGIYDTFFNNEKEASAEIAELTIERNGEQINLLTGMFKNEAELGTEFLEVVDRLAMRQTAKINQMTKADKAKLATMSEGLQISSYQVADVLERQISLTGKASTEIFENISAYSAAVAETTGASYQEIAGQVVQIITDVERFGNVQEEEAARIAGALQQLGLSYQGFGGMVDKYMNFDSAAESLGNLTTVFGVQFDAMEMMMLANEDQEEFLHRMRDAFLESGKAVEDMTLAEKKLAAQQMGMSVQDFENFMQEDRELTDTAAATAAADTSEGLQKMSEQMKLVRTDMDADAQYMKKKVMNELSDAAYELGNDFSVMKTKMKMDMGEMEEYKKLAGGLKEGFSVMAGTSEEGQALMLQRLASQKEAIELTEENAAAVAKLDKLISDAQQGHRITMADLMDLGLRYPELADAVAIPLGEGVKTGIHAGILGGLDADPTEMKQHWDNLKNGMIFGANEAGLTAESPSDALGWPIYHGIMDIFGEEGLLSPDSIQKRGGVFASIAKGGFDSFMNIFSGTPVEQFLSPSDKKVTLAVDSSETTESIVKKLDEVKTSYDKTKIDEVNQSNELSKKLIAGVETLNSTFKEDKKETIINAEFVTDIGTIARGLYRWKGPDGASFAIKEG